MAKGLVLTRCSPGSELAGSPSWQQHKTRLSEAQAGLIQLPQSSLLSLAEILWDRALLQCMHHGPQKEGYKERKPKDGPPLNLLHGRISEDTMLSETETGLWGR